MRKERRHLHHQKARLSKSRLCLDRVLSQREVDVLLVLLGGLEGRLMLKKHVNQRQTKLERIYVQESTVS